MSFGKEKPKILVVMPARNEDNYIATSINSIISQSTRPNLLILVDDGSTDDTPSIMKKYCMNYPYIKYLRIERNGGRDVGAAVAMALIIGVRYASRIMPDWKYLLKVDADTIYERHYITKLIHEFFKNPRLGVASGMTVNEWTDPDHVRGSGMMIRREVWDLIQLKPMLGWDSYIIFKARMLGWEARSFRHIKMKLLRPTGVSEGSVYIGKYKQGIASGILGYAFLTAIGRACKLALEYKSLRIVPYFLAGYIKARLLNIGSEISSELRDWMKYRNYSEIHNIIASLKSLRHATKVTNTR